MFALSVQVISGPNGQNKFQIITLLSGRHVSVSWRYTNIAAPYWTLKFVEHISTNNWRSGKHTDLKLGDVSYLFISYNVIISWVHSLNGFWNIFLIAWRSNLRISASPCYQQISQDAEFVFALEQIERQYSLPSHNIQGSFQWTISRKSSSDKLKYKK